jgi:transglutaminase-like putative cysteine protease
MSASKRTPCAAQPIPLPENTPARLLLRLFQRLAVLLLAVLGFLFCLLTSYQLDLPTETLVWTAVAFSLLFVAVFSLQKSGLLALVCLLAAIAYAIFHADDLLQGVLLLIERVALTLSLNLPEALELLLQPVMADEAIRLMMQAAQALLFIVSFLAAFFIISQPSVPGLALSTLPALLPAPFYLLSPALLPFFMLFAAHMMVFAFNNAKRAQTTLRARVYVPLSRRRADLVAQRAAQHSLSLLVLPLIALSALLSGIVLPQKGYQRPEAIESLQQKIFSLDIGKDAFWRSNDGLTRGDLTSLSSIRFSGATALKVRVSSHSSLYLRDYAGAVYTQGGWENVSANDFSALANSIEIAPQNLLASAAALSGNTPETFTLSVRNIAANPHSIWAPPGLVTRTDEILNAGYVQDTALAFASAASASEYTLEAIPVGMALYSVSSANDGFESAYQKAAGSVYGLSRAEGNGADSVRQAASTYTGYLFSVYTSLPDETHAAAQALLQTYGISAVLDDGALNLAETCQSIRSLLSARCSYEYSPPQIPQGADFATWFLQDARSGYCVHFATTAAVLLRALGIPARYAEGYIVIQKDYEKQPDSEGYIEIEDTHAHAWVEVFDPSLLEWVPVEMTKSAMSPNESAPAESGEPGEETTPSFSESTPEPTPEPTPTPTLEPTPEPDSGTPDPNEDPEETNSAAAAQATPTPAPTSDGTQGTDAAPEGEDETAAAGESQPRPPLWPVFALLVAAGLPLFAFGYRKLKHDRLLHAFLQKDANAAVLLAVQYVLSILHFAGAPEMQPLESPEQYAYNIAKKIPAADRARLESVLLTAQRARFSGRVCTKRDRDAVIAYVDSLIIVLPTDMKRLRRLLFNWRFPAV